MWDMRFAGYKLRDAIPQVATFQKNAEETSHENGIASSIDCAVDDDHRQRHPSLWQWL
jgi:hypothetical protein